MYNPLISYEDNLLHGPDASWTRSGVFPQLTYSGPPAFSVLGTPLHLPLGVPAGPLLSSAFVKVALDAGFCMPVYKTVRSRSWQSHPWPNVLRVQRFADSEDNHLSARPHVDVVPLSHEDVRNPESQRQLSITNAFGVPSLAPEAWSSDFASLPHSSFSDGRMTVLSFQGSRAPQSTWLDFLNDTVKAAQWAAQTVRRCGGTILEMNVSCPNEAGAPIFTDATALRETLRAAAEGLSETPEIKLIIKLGVLPSESILPTIESVSKYAHGISAINTVSATILTPDGQRALGSGAEHGGICGAVIRDQALKIVSQFHQARCALGLSAKDFALIGVGGCATADDFQRFLEAGADVVHAATAAMWNLDFASECARALGVHLSHVSEKDRS
jgi:dihydroorotate dehydrogenase